MLQSLPHLPVHSEGPASAALRRGKEWAGGEIRRPVPRLGEPGALPWRVPPASGPSAAQEGSGSRASTALRAHDRLAGELRLCTLQCWHGWGARGGEWDASQLMAMGLWHFLRFFFFMAVLYLVTCLSLLEARHVNLDRAIRIVGMNYSELSSAIFTVLKGTVYKLCMRDVKRRLVHQSL